MFRIMDELIFLEMIVGYEKRYGSLVLTTQFTPNKPAGWYQFRVPIR